MGLLIVLFLALGHHFVLGLSSSTSGSSRTCLGCAGSRRQRGCGAFAVQFLSLVLLAAEAAELGSAGLSWAGPQGAEGLKMGVGGNTTVQGFGSQGRGTLQSSFWCRNLCSTEDTSWMAHSSVVGLGVPKSCSRPPSPSQPSLCGSSDSLQPGLCSS